MVRGNGAYVEAAQTSGLRRRDEGTRVTGSRQEASQSTGCEGAIRTSVLLSGAAPEQAALLLAESVAEADACSAKKRLVCR